MPVSETKQFNKHIWGILKYKDVSSDRVYFSGVDPNFAKTPDDLKADVAMAWKFQFSLQEYQQLKIES